MGGYSRSGWLPYAIAVAATLLALLVRVRLAPTLFADATFMPFFMAILLAAWFGGLGPGLLAMVSGAVASDWFLLAPIGEPGIADIDDRLQLLLYAVLGTAICAACESLHAARRRTAAVRTDLHELQRMEEHLRQLAADLSEADRRKDRFLATLSHELRNPLAPLRNGLELMKRAAGDASVIEAARGAMERQLAQMVRLVDDLLDVSRITRDKLELRRETVLLRTVVDDAVEAVAPVIEKHGHRLTVSLPSQPVHLDVDPTRAAQVLANLLNNAAKYTDRGGEIGLAVRVDGGDAVVSVLDNGIGVPPADVPKVLEMFGQVDHTLERSQGGLGIGLSLAKRLVEMHGGSIELRPGPDGQGTEVEVRLPVAASPGTQARAAEPAAPVPTRQRVLVVDDNVDSAQTLALMLQAMGHDTRLAHDGEAAVGLADAFRPDVVLLDIGMPKLNGYEACRRIRALPWAGAVRIAAVTGWGQDEDRRRSHDAGFDLHLVKPLDPRAVERLMAGLAQASSPHAW